MQVNRADRIKEVKELCRHSLHTRFPRSCKDVVHIGNSSLILLDADVGMSLSYFVKSETAEIREVDRQHLQEGKERIAALLLLFDAAGIDEEGKRYFRLLHDAAVAILEIADVIPENPEGKVKS